MGGDSERHGYFHPPLTALSAEGLPTARICVLSTSCLFINASMNFILVGNIIISANPSRTRAAGIPSELIFIFILSGTILFRFLTRSSGGGGRGGLIKKM